MKNAKEGGNNIELYKMFQVRRTEKGYTQKEVAEKALISLSTLRRLENGGNVGIYCIQQVANVLGVQIVAIYI